MKYSDVSWLSDGLFSIYLRVVHPIDFGAAVFGWYGRMVLYGLLLLRLRFGGCCVCVVELYV